VNIVFFAYVGRTNLRLSGNRKQPGAPSNLLGRVKLTEMEKNKDDDEVDLHNLYVKEAIAHAEKAIEKARKQGISEIRLIVGMSTSATLGLDN